MTTKLNTRHSTIPIEITKIIENGKGERIGWKEKQYLNGRTLFKNYIFMYIHDTHLKNY